MIDVLQNRAGRWFNIDWLVGFRASQVISLEMFEGGKLKYAISQSCSCIWQLYFIVLNMS